MEEEIRGEPAAGHDITISRRSVGARSSWSTENLKRDTKHHEKRVGAEELWHSSIGKEESRYKAEDNSF